VRPDELAHGVGSTRVERDRYDDKIPIRKLAV
jgi:hypothetical protein